MNPAEDALFAAALGGDSAMVKYLLGRGVKATAGGVVQVEGGRTSRRTALSVAASSGSLDTVMLLCLAGASVNARDEDG